MNEMHFLHEVSIDSDALCCVCHEPIGTEWAWHRTTLPSRRTQSWHSRCHNQDLQWATVR